MSWRQTNLTGWPVAHPIGDYGQTIGRLPDMKKRQKAQAGAVPTFDLGAGPALFEEWISLAAPLLIII